jgi:hypothetical protein
MATLYGDETTSSSQGWQIELFTITAPPQSQFTIAQVPATDADGDALALLKLNGVTQQINVEYSHNYRTFTWISSTALEAGDIIEVFYQPR